MTGNCVYCHRPIRDGDLVRTWQAPGYGTAVSHETCSITCTKCGASVTGYVLHADQCGFARPDAVDQELKPCGHHGRMHPWPLPPTQHLRGETVRDRPCPHDPDDRLAIIQHRGIREDDGDEEWLISEVERLREVLGNYDYVLGLAETTIESYLEEDNDERLAVVYRHIRALYRPPGALDLDPEEAS